jgi:outer membrane immunogenic protein
MKNIAIALGVASIVSAAVPAAAADLPVKAPMMPAVAAAYNWTGCYIGGNVGGKWVRTSGSVDVGATTAPGALGAPGSVLFPSDSASTLIGGGQVGCNYQPAGSNWVFGVEGDVDWQRWSHGSTLAGAANPFPFIAGDSFDWRSNWQSSVRGRIGYAWDRWMIYATGGAAFTNLTVGANFIATTSGGFTFPADIVSDGKTVWGPTFGGGFEYAFTNNFSFGVEGRYSWYGSQTYNAGLLATVAAGAAAAPTFTFAPATQTVKIETFEIMAKLNWKLF